ncbi:MMPL family transporter [uncultured Dechloromonas sp.]|uniref:efflux RND transporter permease subunit n=1 Tax=uncultured Dechloromonas sp. TaxID=171719 RepID=UPI0025DD03BE|nr:MMPL family transporter [uncultured Dechloromonas sp.]
MSIHVHIEDEPGLSEKDFSSNFIGRAALWIFRLRQPLLLLFILITIVLGYFATQLKVEAGFSKMLPLKHEYMQTFLENENTFGGANKVLIAIKSKNGDIYNKEFMDTLRKVTDDVFFVRGVERSSVTSLFSPNVRYHEVVEDGFRGGNIVDSDFAGTPQQLAAVRENVLKSSWVGRIVANDHSSAMVVATLQEQDPQTGARLDLQEVAKRLEEIRGKYENDAVSLHIIGFAKSVGDIASGANGVIAFFAVAFLITAAVLRWYSGSTMLTAWALICAVVPVIWLLGLLPLLGLALDPMSILVPFLIFSIGVSHAVQMTNAWKLETLKGADGVTASRICVLKLFVPGAMALVANALGFLVIAFVDIEMVRELALTATLGVTVMIVTNKMLLPILLSYMKISAKSAQKLAGKETAGDALWERIGPLATRRGSIPALLVGLVLLVAGGMIATDLKIGDLGKGVPELRPDSRYNQDVEVITSKFNIGIDLMQVLVEAKGMTAPCTDRNVLDKMDEFEFLMRQNPGVQSVVGMPSIIKVGTQQYGENFVKWRAIPEDKAQIAQGVTVANRYGNEFMTPGCQLMPISIYTRDHQATTIAGIVDQVKDFQAANAADEVKFKLALGNVGVMAATNEAVAAADKWVNLALFVSVAGLCLLTFRSLAITLCIVIPLGIVTVLCNAVMATLGIGVKVNTLPVVALGVGVGVDYGIYLFERMKHEMQGRGHSLKDAYVIALKQRGTASVFTAVTMTISVITWTFSALKFQADMGILLAFMFLVNMIGAIFLLPALAAWLVRPAASGHKH